MFAVIQVADFPLQALLRLERELADGPVALLDGGQRPPVVLACTLPARNRGVMPGQTAPQAMARCEGLTMRTRREDAETEARAGLLAAALAVSPQVEDTAPGMCTIDVTALADERREAAVRAAVAQLAGLGLNATAGLAATPLLARYAAQQTARFLRVDRQREFLRDLPLAVAEPPPELAGIFANWGVRTLGELTALPKAEVTQRFGAEGLALWERAAGETTRPLKPAAPAPVFAAEMTLEHAVETLEPLLFVLRRFIDRLALELRNAGWVAGEMRLALALADETVHTREFRLPEPTTREEILLRVLHSHLESLRTEAEVNGVALECRPVRPRRRQQGLFDSALKDPHGFNETLARVAAVIGAECMGTPQVENSHRPDAVRLTLPPAVVETVRSGNGETDRGRGLALRRWRPPLAATVELSGLAPSFVWTPAVHGAVTARQGPWRGSGEWWDAERCWRGEEWDVELEGGGVYRLRRTPAGWFLEGEYD